MSSAPMHPQLAMALPSLAGYALMPALDKIQELGFAAVMGLLGGPRTCHSQGEFPTFQVLGAATDQVAAVRQRLATFARVSVHQSWDDDWQQWLGGAAAIGAEIVTVHADHRRDGETQQAFVQREHARLQQIGDRAAQLGLRVGVENAGGWRDDYLQLLTAVEHPAVGATVDVGHCAYFAEVRAVESPWQRIVVLNQTIADLVTALGRRLYHFHVHNVRAADWRDHRSAPHGAIDFPRLVRQLRRAGYTGLFDIELEEADREAAARETGDYLSALLRGAA